MHDNVPATATATAIEVDGLQQAKGMNLETICQHTVSK